MAKLLLLKESGMHLAKLIVLMATWLSLRALSLNWNSIVSHFQNVPNGISKHSVPRDRAIGRSIFILEVSISVYA